MTWALQRQIIYLAILLIFLAVAGAFISYPYLNKAPTCSDGAQNGTETGVDCGGSCMRACTLQVDQISIIWARAFKIAAGRYNAVAYLENHNKNAAVQKLHYRFRFSDDNNVYVGSREGDAYIPPGGKFAIFEPAIGVGNSIPVYTNFEFTETPIWVQVPQDRIDQLKIGVNQIALADEATSPRLSAVLKNNSLFNVPELNVIAILYDASGNAISASKTYLDVLSKSTSVGIVFTWPEPFTAKVVSKEIIPIANVFSATLQ